MTVIKEHLLFGTTEGDIKEVRLAAYKQKNFTDLALHNYNAHNEFIGTLATYGIIGFILFMGILFLPFRKAEYRRSYSLFIIIVVITFLTESILDRQQGLNYFMFFYALYALPKASVARNE